MQSPKRCLIKTAEIKEEKIEVKATYFPGCVIQNNSGGY